MGVCPLSCAHHSEGAVNSIFGVNFLSLVAENTRQFRTGSVRVLILYGSSVASEKCPQKRFQHHEDCDDADCQSNPHESAAHVASPNIQIALN